MAPLYVPAKRRLTASDPFFDLGNAEASVHYIERRCVPHAQAWESTESLINIDDWLFDAGALHDPIICHDPPCHGSAHFPSTLAYERHYDQAHRNVCSVCRAILPSAHWLDLHIQEHHDAFFSARVARGEKAFACFLPACTRVFSRPQKRKLHMIDKHHFARSFNWSLVRSGLRSANSADVDRLASAFQRSVSFGRHGTQSRMQRPQNNRTIVVPNLSPHT
ncbi:hypothetical protein GGH19_004543 [Coemansia sp. RSA 1807]|nr:hypothetical protein IW142_000297 [Coemansia sp. RSA 564]KAJ2171371.1 hypothetical protein GGH16_002895 [Coemansia sp. RSA 560]KAJ2573311.1 hypothetical protein GGH19_004543 [Coemansia sp. RSA 1807]